jgi:pimeloyl-ACP methyl ester carboxylesterase
VYDAVGNQLETGTVAVTGVSQVTPAPNRFIPGGGNITTITVNGGPSLSLEARIFNGVTGVLVKTIELTEASGVYTGEWDGRDTYGNFAGANTYYVGVFSTTSGFPYSPQGYVVVEAGVFAIEASPDPFVPTGTSLVTLTVRADPGLSGLTVSVSSTTGDSRSGIPLTETGSVGTYVGTWNGTVNGVIARNGVYTTRVYDASGNTFPTTGTLTLSSVRAFSVTPNLFEPNPGVAASITAEVAAGLQLEGRIGSLVTIPLTGVGSSYSALWPGTDNSGRVLAPGSYTMHLYNASTGTRYSLSTGFQIVDTTPPDAVIATGPAEGATIPERNVTFAWTGTDNTGGALTFATRLDGGALSTFSASTGETLIGLELGSHTFEVYAKDSSGNIDPVPAVRHFTVADQTYTFDTSTGFGAYAEGATAQFSAYVFSATNPTTPLTSATVSVRFSVRNAAGAVIVAPSYLGFNSANSQFSGTVNTSGLALGSYTAVFEIVDPSGTVVGMQTEVFDVVRSFAVSVGTDRAEYDRGQSVTISGNVLDEAGAPLSGMPVAVVVTSRGFSRQFGVFTGAQGGYQFTFNPGSNEAGRYTAEAQVTRDGLLKRASAPFLIHGFLLSPQLLTVNMSMNSSQGVPLTLQNIGETPLTGIVLAVQDTTPGDGVGAAISVNGFTGALAAGASQQVSLVVTAPAGSPPGAPATFTVVGTTAEAVGETSSVRVNLREAQGVPVVEPASLQVGMNPGKARVESFVVRNEGFATMANTRVQLHDQASFPWVGLQDAWLGDLVPGASRTFGVSLFPPANLQLGLYVVQIDLVTDAGSLPIFVTVEITSSQVRPVAVQVSDDTGADVAGAGVTLVSDTIYRRVTPAGTDTYNHVAQGTSDGLGRVSFASVPAGKYTLRVQAAGHLPYEAPVVVEAGGTPQQVEAILQAKVADFRFSVVPTTVTDQYDVSLIITYSTDLVKPALITAPSLINLSFFPEETIQGAITITNSHTQTAVTNVLVDASRLDPGFKQLKVLFSFQGTESSVMPVAAIGPGETVTIPYRATLPAGADLSSRCLGTISVTGSYIYSLRGVARVGTTESGIFACFNRPTGLRMMPPLAFLNDETDGVPGDLKYQGTTYQISLENLRLTPIDFRTFADGFATEPPVRALSVPVPQGTPLDELPLSLLDSADVYWEGTLRSNRLETRGSRTTFDITTLEGALETYYADVITRPVYLGVVGKWADAGSAQGFLFPVSIITKRPGEVVVSTPAPGPGLPSSWGGGGGPTPVPFNDHGQVKIQIDQTISLEREAFDARLDITPAVTLDAFSAAISIKDAGGADALDRFVIIDTQVPVVPIQAPSSATWLLIPKVDAGGDQEGGLQYTVGARLSYSTEGIAHTFDVAPQTITVKPLPKLRVTYAIPYVVMGEIPFDLDVEIVNVGKGAASGLKIASGQPKIIDNPNHIPIEFGIDGSFVGAGAYQPGNTTIEFPTLGAGSTAAGTWRMHTTRRGFFIDFASTLSHRTIRGKEIDPLIETVQLGFIPAIGGHVTRTCNRGNASVALDGTTLMSPVNVAGDYYIQDVPPRSRLANPPASYTLRLSQDGAQPVLYQIDVLADQPTDFIDLSVDNSALDTDHDLIPDCTELAYGLDPDNPADASQDADGDGLNNRDEIMVHKTDPRRADTDGDTVDDGTEVALGTDPLRPDAPPLADSDGDSVPDASDACPGTPGGVTVDSNGCARSQLLPRKPISLTGAWGVTKLSGVTDFNVLLQWEHPTAETEVVTRYDIFVRRFNLDIDFSCQWIRIPYFPDACVPTVSFGQVEWNYLVDTRATFALLPLRQLLLDAGIIIEELLSGFDGLEFSVSAVNAQGPGPRSDPFAVTLRDYGITLPQPNRPVLFVHGWNGDAGTWEPTTRTLKGLYGWADGGTVSYVASSGQPRCVPSPCNFTTALYRLDFDDPTTTTDERFDGVRALAERLERIVGQLTSTTGRAILVGHSAGGVVSRACVQLKIGSCDKRVERLVTHGSPHLGTIGASGVASLDEIRAFIEDILGLFDELREDLVTAEDALRELARKESWFSLRFPELLGELTAAASLDVIERSLDYLETPGRLLRQFVGWLEQKLDSDLVQDLRLGSPILQTLNGMPLPEGTTFRWLVGNMTPLNIAAATVSPALKGLLLAWGVSDGFIESASQDLSPLYPASSRSIWRFARLHCCLPGFGEGWDYVGVLRGLGYEVLRVEAASPVVVAVVDPFGRYMSAAATSLPGAVSTSTGAVEIINPASGRYTVFAAPTVDQGTFSLTLEAAGGEVTLASNVDVTSAPQGGYRVLVANAGRDQTVRQGSVVRLDAQAGPGPLTFAWRLEAGPPVTLGGPTTGVATFTPTTAGVYRFSLTIGDGVATSAPSYVTITVPVRGDMDGDGDVDIDDVNIITAARNTLATGPNDVRDLNGDGKIDALDARIAATLCTRLRCAVK